MTNTPHLNRSYWILMLLCTTMGELIGNLLSRNFQLGYTQGAVLDLYVLIVLVSVFMVFKLQREIFYWILILAGNIGGTNLADWVTLEPLANDLKWGIFKPLELGTQKGSLAVAGLLFVILMIRYAAVKHRGEDNRIAGALYWAAILLSSTFGTTSGDFITNDTPLGALGGSIFLLALLAVSYTAYKNKWLSGAATYWLALVLMHPIGATIGNWVSKPIGLNLGNVYTNVTMVILFAAIFLRDQRHRLARGHEEPLSPAN